MSVGRAFDFESLPKRQAEMAERGRKRLCYYCREEIQSSLDGRQVWHKASGVPYSDCPKRVPQKGGK